MGFLDHGFQKMFCSNSECPKHTESSGGKFSLVNGKWYCSECAGMAGCGSTAKNLWDFTTNHFTGHPVHVKSLAHLRQLEKQYGCSNHAANFDQRNW